MNMFRIVLHLFHFLSWFVQESHSHGGFCGLLTPVVNICTDQVLTKRQDVFLDTVSVPMFQHTSCECIISPFKYEVGYTFDAFPQNYPKGMEFRINDIVIKEETARRGNTYLMSETLIYFSTAEVHIMGEGTCVSVYADDRSFFNITCMKSTISTTEQSTSTTTRYNTESSIPTITRNVTKASIPTTTRNVTKASITTSSGNFTTPSISSSSEGVTEAELNTGPYEDTGQASLIIPLVTAISGIVCLAIVIAVIIFCKRRKTQNRRMLNGSKSTAEQEQENNYYMTENPMYNVTETQPNAEHTENVYHYIEHNQLDSRRPTVQYESLPDSPVGKHLPTNLSKHNQNYDYTTCQESGYVAGNTNTLDTGNERGKMPREMMDAGETMYDRTDKAAVKQFSGMDEYHHLRPAGSSEKFVLDTYDTIGKVVDKEEEQKEPEYDVTHSR